MKKFSGLDRYTYLLNRLLLIFNIGLFTSVGVFSQSATITPSTMLNEINLDTEYITVTLVDSETFKDYLNLKIDSFTPVGEPPGTTIESVVGLSATEAIINLAFNGTDFDVEYPYFHVMIEVEKTEAVTTLCRNIATNVKPIPLRHLDGQLKSAWNGHCVRFFHKPPFQ